MSTPKVSPARRRAMAVLLNGETTGRPVVVSNGTTRVDELDTIPFTDGTGRHGRITRLTIYWQVADWLTAHGYATANRRLGADQIQLTATGRTLAEETTGG